MEGQSMWFYISLDDDYESWLLWHESAPVLYVYNSTIERLSRSNMDDYVVSEKGTDPGLVMLEGPKARQLFEYMLERLRATTPYGAKRYDMKDSVSKGGF